LSGVVLAILFAWSLDEPLETLPWEYLISFAAVFALMGMYAYWIGKKVYEPGIVKCVVGRTIFVGQGKNRSLKINGEYFPAKQAYEGIFVRGFQYKIYYAPSDDYSVRNCF
jgi:hypothetical protein